MSKLGDDLAAKHHCGVCGRPIGQETHMHLGNICDACEQEAHDRAFSPHENPPETDNE